MGSKKIYIIPNLVTTGNLFCGFYSMVSAIHYDFVTAAWAIAAATIFDALDGRVARLAKATSSFGVEYDSLCDLVSFGVAPAMLFYLWALEPHGRLGWLAAFLFVACSALRLARFNVTTESVSKNYFQGMPTPFAALLISTFVIFSHQVEWSHAWLRLVNVALILGLSTLMVSSVPMPSFKEVNWKSKTSAGYLLVGLMLIVFVAIRPEVTLFLGLLGYLAVSLLWALYHAIRGDAPWALTETPTKAE